MPHRRPRSHRYPGVPLGEAVELARTVEARGLDGLPATPIAEALGFKNIKTNAFSARLSAARQFGLLKLVGDGYGLTDLARAVLHPVAADDTSALRRALFEPPLYGELAARFAGAKVPDPPVLANLLYHHHKITAAAKSVAADAFLASARQAGVLGADGVLRADGAPPDAPDPSSTSPSSNGDPPAEDRTPRVGRKPSDRPRTRAGAPSPVRLDFPLWGPDAGKVIRVRAPEAMTPESFDRFLQALRLHVRIEGPPTG